MPEPFRREMDKYNFEACVLTHKDLDRRLSNVEKLLERVSNRPPVWATALISLLSLAVGVLAGQLV